MAVSLRRFLTVSCAPLLMLALSYAQSTPPAKKPAARSKTSHHPRTSAQASRGHLVRASSTSRQTSSKHKKSRHSTASWRKRGQQKIDPQRAREIQTALIRQHYMSGEPTGVWDDATQKAMQRFQADNGWQNKTTPDSRALIKLGLGPDHAHLLNPESAMTGAAEPAAAHDPASGPAGSKAAGAVSTSPEPSAPVPAPAPATPAPEHAPQ